MENAKPTVKITGFDQPKDVSDAEIAFGGINGLMPPYKGLEEFDCYSRGKKSWGRDLFMDWFYKGLKSLELYPKQGIDKNKALRHIKAVMQSFEPSHEHKVAACAFLFEKWFESGKWECGA